MEQARTSGIMRFSQPHDHGGSPWTPADPSSPIPSGLTPLCDADPLRPVEPPHLLAYLATITDPRSRAGRRHPLVAILGLAAAAVLAGARSVAAIAEWAADAPQPVRAALGARRDRFTGH
jgi:DDE_Tnp_1-associated